MQVIGRVADWAGFYNRSTSFPCNVVRHSTVTMLVPTQHQPEIAKAQLSSSPWCSTRLPDICFKLPSYPTETVNMSHSSGVPGATITALGLTAFLAAWMLSMTIPDSAS